MHASLSNLCQEKEDNPYNFFLFYILSKPLYFICCRGSKLAFIHRVKERKTPSLSAQSSFAPFSLKVAWSGKSLIEETTQEIGIRHFGTLGIRPISTTVMLIILSN